MNIAVSKKFPLKRFTLLGALGLSLIGSTTYAATFTSTAYVNGVSSSQGKPISTSVGSGTLRAYSSGPTYGVTANNKKYISVLPDKIVKSVYAGPGKDVKVSWKGETGSYYPTAQTEYNVTSISGAGVLTTNN
ncbi:hypothetical protein [Priestia megaterium]|uniref:hypothetical protein n=1 Tax=Priestia megaterium TaxID=1404 RepID=UPI002FFEA9B8